MLIQQVLFLFFISGTFCNTVKTPLGTIRGYHQMSHGGRKFSAFEGIPYAKPPIGHKRFEEPEPIQPWSGTWVATHLSECAQTVMTQPNVTTGEEDCLYINVYVPREVPNPGERLDVVVHIHGGAYMYLSGHTYAKPEFLMDKEVIFVTFNYRLGVLGFLSTEDEVVPGNNGMKDQVLALKWVQNNIASFGGNPKSVTITGLSAGGSSVHLHYFSPLSRGLFHRGFSQSGTATNFWTLQKAALSKAKRLGESLGCYSISTRVLIDCLKEKPVGQILDKVRLFFEYQFMPVVPFGPIVEKTKTGAFLTDSPFNLLKKLEVQDVPWISSNTAHEGVFPEIFLVNDFDNVDKNWATVAPVLLDFNYTLPKQIHSIVSQKIKEYYFGKNAKLSQDNAIKLIKMFSDRFFLVECEAGVKLQASVSKSPVYYYFFTYPGDLNDLKLVGHGDDAKYFFGSTWVPRALTEDELKMKDIMLDMLASYAKTGVPVVKEVEWKPTGSDQLTYLNIGSFKTDGIKLEKNEDLTGAKEFWESLGFIEKEYLSSIKDEL